jgi:hypothetical protein
MKTQVGRWDGRITDKNRVSIPAFGRQEKESMV